MVSVDLDGASTLPELKRLEAKSGRVPTLLMLGRLADGAVEPARRLPLTSPLSIGRGKAFPDALLSRQHLTISPGRGGHVIEDVGSLNGTYLDGRRLTGPVRLSEGSIICFGGQAAVFRRVSAQEAAAIDEEAAAPFGPVASISPALSLALHKLRRLARGDMPLLLVGETGVGKEVYARAVHEASGRRGRFVAINCAALPAELVESELFGYVRGAHSTAAEPKRGLVEAADGGTLLLDEIGDMPLRLQTKLFRFLQEREIVPLGGTAARRVDVRILAATSGLNNDDEDGSPGLRPDLLARLGAEPIVIPPLRERMEDLVGLIGWFGAGTIREIDPGAFRALCLHGWPLNVRELESCIKRALALLADGCIRPEHLPAAVAASVERGPPISDRRRHRRPAPARAELEHLLRVHGGNISEVARSLDRQWNVVWRWLVRHELQPDRFRR